MEDRLTTAHWDAVLSLQAMRDRHQPGSFHHEVADHAIDLIISGTRAAQPYLLRNAYRDARSILIRRKRRQEGREAVPVDDEAANPDAALRTSTSESIDHRIVYLDAYERLKSSLGPGKGYGQACLDAWCLGDSLEETAKALNISPEYVKKIRSAIRAKAHAVLPEMRRAA